MIDDYKHFIEKEVLKLKKAFWVDRLTIDKFLKRIREKKPLTKYEGVDDHICCFFLPIDCKFKKIYLGHHIKADDWIPPGGYINKNELPIETVIREFEEELNYKLSNEKIKLFDLSIKAINRPKHHCLVHYDFWYLVYIGIKDFVFDRGEFYQASWFTFPQAVKKIKLKTYNQIVQKIKSFL